MINFTLKGTKSGSSILDRSDYLKFDLNESLDVLPSDIIENIKKFDSKLFSEYPDYSEVTKKISRYANVSAKNILITNGGSRAIDIILHSLFAKNDKILIPSPTFTLYTQYLDTLQCKSIVIPYQNKSSGFVFPFKELKQEIKNGAQGIIICNPNNPLGTDIPLEKLEDIIMESAKNDIPCIIDEAYFEFGSQSAINLVDKYDNLVIIRTFSKIFGLAGLRFGYIVAQEYIIKTLETIRGVYDVNSMALLAVSEILKKETLAAKIVETVQETKKLFETNLRKLGFSITPTKTNFSLVKHFLANEIAEELQKQKYLVKDLSNYPHSFGLTKNMLRISISSHSNMKLLKNKIEEILKEIS